jgi:hypothetical protein
MPAPNLPFSTTWTGAAGDGQWSNPANWTNGVPFNPGTLTTDQQDVAIVDNSVLTTPYTVTIAGNQFVQDLTLDVTTPSSSPAISLTGTLVAAWNAFNNGAAFGNIELQSGTFEIDGGQLAVATVNQDGGTLTFGNAATWGASVLNADEINGPLTIGNGSEVIAAPNSFFGIGGSAPDTITIVQDSTLSVQGNIYLAGTVYVDSGVLAFDGGDFQSDPGSVDVEIGAAGSVVAIANTQLENTLIDGNLAIEDGAVFNEIAGDTLTIESGGGLSPGTVSLDGNSTLDVQGTLDLLGTVDLTGDVTGGGTLQVEGVLNGGTVTDSDASTGSVVIDPVGTATLNGVDIATNIQLQGNNGGPAGTLLITGNSVFGDGSGTTVDLGGGTLWVAGTLSLQGVTLQNGTLVLQDGAVFTPDSASSLVNITEPQTTPQATVWNGSAGDGLWSDANNWTNGVPYNPLALTSDQQDTATIDNSIETTPYTVTIAGQEFVQDLTLDATDPAGGVAVSLTGTLEAAWNTVNGAGGTPGTIALQQGDFELDGGMLVGASVNLNGGTISFGSFAAYGAPTLASSDITSSFTIGNTSDVVLAPSSLVIFSGTTSAVVTIAQSSTLSVQGTLASNGTLDITSGVLSLDGGSVAGNGGDATIIENGGTLVETANSSLDNTTIDGDWTIAPNITVTVAPNSTTTLQLDANGDPAIVTIGSNGMLNVLGTLDLSGTLEGGTVQVEGTVVGGSIAGGVLMVAGSGTVTLDNTTILSAIDSYSGATLVITGNDTIGQGGTVNLGGNTLAVAGNLDLRGATLENGWLQLDTGGSLNPDSSSTIYDVNFVGPPPASPNATMSGQNVTLTATYWMTPGDTLSVETGVNGAGNPSGTAGTFTNTGTGYLVGAGLLRVTDANGPSTANLDTTVWADITGQTLHIDADTVNVSAILQAIDGGTLELGDTSATPLTSTILYGGLYYAQGASTILVDDLRSITEFSGTVSLDGAGSEVEANAGGAAVTLESSLLTVGGYTSGLDPDFTGTLNLLNGRGFAAQNALNLAGTIALEGGVLSSPTITGYIYFSPYGGVSAPVLPTIVGHGVVEAALGGYIAAEASGGTLELAGALPGRGVLEALDNSTLIIDQSLSALNDTYTTGYEMVLYNNATIASYGSVAAENIEFSGTRSVVFLVNALGQTTDVSGTLNGNSIDLSGVQAQTNGNGVPDIAIIRQSETVAQVVVTPVSGGNDVFNITGDFGQTGITTMNDGDGGTLIQFSTPEASAIPTILSGNGLTQQSPGVFVFTTNAHVRKAGAYDPAVQLLIENYPNLTASSEGTLSGQVGAVSGQASASGSFYGLAAGQTTNNLPAGYGTPIQVSLNTATASQVTGSVTLQFASTGTQGVLTQGLAVSILPDVTVNLIENVWAYANPYFYQQTFYVRASTTPGYQALNLPVYNYIASGYGEGLIATIVGNSGDLTNTAIQPNPTGTTTLVAAGQYDTSSLTLYADSDIYDWGAGFNAVQTENIYVQVTSDGDGTSGLGMTNLGTYTVPIRVYFTQPAAAYIATPQIFHIPAVSGNLTFPLDIAVYNTAVAGVSEGLVAQVLSYSGAFSFVNSSGQLEQTTDIAAGSSDTTSLAFSTSANPSGFANGTAAVQTGTVVLGLWSNGTGVDNSGTTYLGQVTVPIQVYFDGFAQPYVQTTYNLHVSQPSATPSTQTLQLGIYNTAPTTGYYENLQATLLSSTGDFTSSSNPNITVNPSGTTALIAPGAGGPQTISFQAVTDAAVVAASGNASETGTFTLGMTSLVPNYPTYGYNFPNQNYNITVNFVGYANPVIDGVNDPPNNPYTPTAGTPLTDNVNLGIVLLGTFRSYPVYIQNTAPAPADSLEVYIAYSNYIIGASSSIAALAPGTGNDDNTFIAHGDIVGNHTQTVSYVPLSEDLPGAQLTYLTPVNVTYTWTVEKPTQSAIAWGDVHITTFDGVAYNFQAEGEFVLAKATDPDNSFQIQVRLQPPAGAQVTLITDLGLKLGNDTVTFEAGRTPLMYIDGAPSDISATNALINLAGGSIALINGTYRVTWNTGETMELTDSGSYLNVESLTLGPNDGPNSMEGLLGPANGGTNDFQLPNGSYLPTNNLGQISSSDLYGTFATSWAVTDATSLLDYPGGVPDTAAYTDVNFPTDAVSLTDLPTSVQTAALAAAAAAGITDPVLQQQAALDYALTGSTEFLTSGANAQQQNGNVVAAGVSETAPPLPLLGVAAIATSATEAASGATLLDFTAYLTSAGTTDTTVDYAVTAPGAGYLGAAAFGGTLPSGSVIIPTGSTMATITIPVPQDALGSDPTDTVQVTISTPDSNQIIASVAQTALINSAPVPGSPAVPEVALLSNIGTQTQNSGTLAVSLGDVVQGEPINPLQFQISNGAAAGADNLAGTLADLQLPAFIMQGSITLTPLSPGSSYQGLQVVVNTATLGAGADTITYLPTDENETGYSATLAAQSITLSDTVIAPAQAQLNTPGPFSFGTVHAGASPAPEVLSVSNKAAPGAAGLDVGLAITAGGFSASGAINQLGAGTTDTSSLSIGELTSTAGPDSGFATLTFTSDAGDGNTLSDGSATIELSGTVYRLAQPGSLAPVYLHIGDAGTLVALPLANLATADGYSENLTGHVVGTSGGISTAGSIGEIVPGVTSNALTLTVPTTAAGSGSVTLDLISDGTTIDGLGTTDLGDVTQSVFIDNLATAAIDEVSGGGSLSVTGSASMLSLGTLALDTGNVVIQLDARNAASGQADLLSGTFTVSGNPAFVNSGPDGFSGLSAGATTTGPEITLATTLGGTFSETFTLDATGSNPSGYSADLGDETFTVTATVLCFLAGTLIGTPSGETPVERLAIGDMVVTASGEARPIVWIGIGRVLATRGQRSAATPVIIRKGALANNVPHHDLRVTKAHALYLDDVLIPVEFLVNHRSILWDDAAQEVSLYHIELATHDVLLANGAPAESYRDDGNRWLFQNANTGWDLPPKPPCAPVLTGGPIVDAAWRRLLHHAGPRPGLPLTREAGLHVLAGGVRHHPARRYGDALVFLVQDVAGGIRIVSRAAAPQELGLMRDPRSLGVALRRVTLCRGRQLRVIEADDPLLTDGFHAFEADNGFRWTDGDALLPAALLDGFAGPMELTLHVASTAHYIEDGDARDTA